ncbi:MAG: putative cyclase [Ilumatobacteraceae bacterium]|nr:putative cyclase [Ilumatobacteraceae bacterium]
MSFSFGPEFEELAAQVTNWGRWGADDEIGTINLITSEAVRRGVAAVRTGRNFSLALPLSEAEGIQAGFIPGRVNPLRAMTQLNVPMTGDPTGPCVNDDVVTMGLQCATHWDGLGHVSYQGVLYNGYPAAGITCFGASQCGIQQVGSIVTRGVLLDVAAAKGVDRLDGGYAITGEDLDAAAELGKVSVQPGDVVLLRTGHIRLLPDKFAYGVPSPGPSIHSVRWFRDHDVAAVATDNLTFEVWPCLPDGALLPVHILHLTYMGMMQGQNWNLEALSADCAADGIYEFLLSASPQPFTAAVGSPVNPIATK